ncbi:ComEC/Rec2 family competence protein [Candidatus Oscillochloris fontis]|uniref:ComEC/Rec2 family competence protein n=1 Tax=Candidatus Oscillochloris fontis TaxID=2496868 RepID=UPI00101C5A16|nr:MBL fold metallo-hydrolase [Candidatus Oscillochloris fontis]
MTFQHSVKIAFLDVGQGDSIVVTVPDTGEAVIIDCPEADTVIEYLRGENIRFIRALIITHLHLDHFKESVGFLENCRPQLGIECERLIFNWFYNRQPPPPDADEHSEISSDLKIRERVRRTAYQELVTWAEQEPNKLSCIPLLRPRSGDRLEIEGTITQAIRILQPSHAQMGKLNHLGLNNTSAILRIESSGSSALLTADIEPSGWNELRRRHADLRSDVLKFPHHGAWKNANPTDILDAVEPSIVVVSVGTDGSRYDHPNDHVFHAIRDLSEMRLLCTQVTSRCVENPSSHKDAIQAILEADATSRGMRHIRTPRGCPCAGTIIIELGKHIKVLQPDTSVHRDQIIQGFLHSHRCVI